MKDKTANNSYEYHFFNSTIHKISKVEFQSLFFSEADIERTLLEGRFSFAYLREDKLRNIDVYDTQGVRIKSNEFLKRFGIVINSSNLFKTGKYLSRVFRPSKYGSFVDNLDIHMNQNHNGKVTDGISLISLRLAHRLGWKEAQPEMSSQFTLFYKDGLVKGHCVVSDKIEHDVVIYGDDNIKKEITLTNGLNYIALEPVKLGNSLRLDIQSLLNLWEVFEGEKYLQWAFEGIEKFKEDLFNGKLVNWLDNFNEIDNEKYENENWTLRKAIWSKVDFRRYPGLVRAAWTMFRSSILTYAENSKGEPVFRIPVPDGKRAYLRVDLRNHNKDGNFCTTVKRQNVELDKYGNLWLNPNDAYDTLTTLGGADFDDSVGIIPVEDNKAIIYRNPNQYGELVHAKIIYKGVKAEAGHNISGSFPSKYSFVEQMEFKRSVWDNTMLSEWLKKREKLIPTNNIIMDYTIANLIRAYNTIKDNSTNIGYAANGEMARSAIRITQEDYFLKIKNRFIWSLERIIDATVKDGIAADEDMKAVSDMYEYIIENKIPLPKSLFYRLPKKIQDKVCLADKHPLDELLEAVKYFIEEADKEILGSGSVSKGNRVKGKIDNLDIPIIEIGRSNLDNPLFEIGVSLLGYYNKNIAILLDITDKLPTFEKEMKRKEGIDKIQKSFLSKLSKYTIDERCLLAKVFAYQIYKTNRAPHDSILWIRDIDGLHGTANDTIQMLANLELGCQIKNNGSLKRVREKKVEKITTKNIRIWSSDSVSSIKYECASEILIESNKALINGSILNVGEECRISEGVYKIYSVVQAISRSNSRPLKNSLVVYLQN
ncbi:MAG: hypothetical protein F9K45_00770 [Melioribacteraceae bacterium]|nr:MAG: hypothetical protein F9K45_00770 [Melioribacteraceae bacterium]